LIEFQLTKRLRDYTLSLGLSVQGGEILALTGKNGSGKSTTLHMIAGLTEPDSGFIRLHDRTLFDSGKGLQKPPEERHIGYILQNALVFPHMSVRDNIVYGLRSRRVPRPEIDKKVAGLVQDLDIGHLVGLNAGQLSGGQKQIVVLARALAIDPDLLLLDEPFRALDKDVTQMVRETILNEVRSRNIPCILVTQHMDETLLPGCKVCRMDEGRIVEG